MNGIKIRQQRKLGGGSGFIPMLPFYPRVRFPDWPPLFKKHLKPADQPIPLPESAFEEREGRGQEGGEPSLTKLRLSRACTIVRIEASMRAVTAPGLFLLLPPSRPSCAARAHCDWLLGLHLGRYRVCQEEEERRRRGRTRAGDSSPSELTAPIGPFFSPGRAWGAPATAPPSLAGFPPKPARLSRACRGRGRRKTARSPPPPAPLSQPPAMRRNSRLQWPPLLPLSQWLRPRKWSWIWSCRRPGVTGAAWGAPIAPPSSTGSGKRPEVEGGGISGLLWLFSLLSFACMNYTGQTGVEFCRGSSW